MSTYVYEVNLTLPNTFAPGLTSATDWVQGTITTDCNNCIISAHDIVDWNLNVAVHGWPLEFLTGPLSGNNSILQFQDYGNVAATPFGMWVNFGPGFNWLQMGFDGNGAAVAFGLNTIGWSATDQVGITTDIINPVTDLIAVSVPEPATWALLLFGFAIFGLRRQMVKS